MVRIIGKLGADKLFVSSYPLDGVGSAKDVEPELWKAEVELSWRKREFEESLPGEIEREKRELAGLEAGKRGLEAEFDEKSKLLSSQAVESRARVSKAGFLSRLSAVAHFGLD